MENKWLNEAFKGEVPSGFQGKVGWASPSNIALVKYWGKRGKQLPQNPSISFTLSECRSETFVTYEKADHFEFKFFFDGKENPDFGAKIDKFLIDYQAFFPFINQMSLTIESRNNFPHSSGIASSASSMSADRNRIFVGRPFDRLRDLSQSILFFAIGLGQCGKVGVPENGTLGSNALL